MLMMSDILTRETLDAIETTVEEDALVYLAYVVGMHRGVSVQEWMSVSIERLRAHRVFEDAAVREDNAILQRIDTRLAVLRAAADAVERIKSIDHRGDPMLINSIEQFQKVFGAMGVGSKDMRDAVAHAFNHGAKKLSVTRVGSDVHVLEDVVLNEISLVPANVYGTKIEMAGYAAKAIPDE